MKIIAADVIVTSPDRNFVTLRITTDEGVTGLGDATLNGRELAVASYLTEHVAPLLIGRDPHRIEDTWQFLYRSAYWRRGPVTMAAIAAVDVALWDIKAKAAGHAALPAARRRLPDRASWPTGTPPAATPRSCSTRSASTSSWATARSGCRPRCRASTRCTASPPSRAPAGSATTTSRPQRTPLPAEEDWDTRAYLRHIPAVFEAVRERVRPRAPAAARRAPPDDARSRPRGSARRWSRTTCSGSRTAPRPRTRRRCAWSGSTRRRPLAIGEVFNTVWDYQTLISEQLIDYVRSAVTHTGGITAMRKLLDFAAQYQIKSGIHGPTDISPVGMAARCTSTWRSTTSASRSTCGTAR